MLSLLLLVVVVVSLLLLLSLLLSLLSVLLLSLSLLLLLSLLRSLPVLLLPLLLLSLLRKTSVEGDAGAHDEAERVRLGTCRIDFARGQLESLAASKQLPSVAAAPRFLAIRCWRQP
jgi:hypothetical protein